MYWRRMFWDNDFRIFQYVSSDIIHSVWYPSAQPCTITDPSRHRNLRGSSDSNVATPQNFLSARVFRDEVVFLVWLVFGHTKNCCFPLLNHVCVCVSRKINILPRVGIEHVFLWFLVYSSNPECTRAEEEKGPSQLLEGSDWIRLGSTDMPDEAQRDFASAQWGHGICCLALSQQGPAAWHAAHRRLWPRDMSTCESRLDSSGKLSWRDKHWTATIKGEKRAFPRNSKFWRDSL